MRRFALGRDRRGAAAVEFALCIWALIAMMLGIIEAGRLYLVQHTLEYGVARAARVAVVDGSRSASPSAICGNTIAAFTAAIAPALGSTASVTLTVTLTTSSGTSTCTKSSTATVHAGDSVSIAASHQWAPVAGLLSLPAVTLTASTAGTIQN